MLVSMDKGWTQGKYLNFQDLGKCDSYKAKTRIFSVISRITYRPLGAVKWYSGWRKYTYHPFAGIILDSSCMRDISEFCDLKTEEQKADWKPSNVYLKGHRVAGKG